MAEDQKMDEVGSNGMAAAPPVLGMNRRDWVTPQFECIPLSEAMGPVLNHIASDGANLYS